MIRRNKGIGESAMTRKAKCALQAMVKLPCPWYPRGHLVCCSLSPVAPHYTVRAQRLWILMQFPKQHVTPDLISYNKVRWPDQEPENDPIWWSCRLLIDLIGSADNTRGRQKWTGSFPIARDLYVVVVVIVPTHIWTLAKDSTFLLPSLVEPVFIEASKPATRNPEAAARFFSSQHDSPVFCWRSHICHKNAMAPSIYLRAWRIIQGRAPIRWELLRDPGDLSRVVGLLGEGVPVSARQLTCLMRIEFVHLEMWCRDRVMWEA